MADFLEKWKKNISLGIFRDFRQKLSRFKTVQPRHRAVIGLLMMFVKVHMQGLWQEGHAQVDALHAVSQTIKP